MKKETAAGRGRAELGFATWDILATKDFLYCSDTV